MDANHTRDCWILRLINNNNYLVVVVNNIYHMYCNVNLKKIF